MAFTAVIAVCDKAAQEHTFQFGDAARSHGTPGACDKTVADPSLFQHSVQTDRFRFWWAPFLLAWLPARGVRDVEREKARNVELEPFIAKVVGLGSCQAQ